MRPNFRNGADLESRHAGKREIKVARARNGFILTIALLAAACGGGGATSAPTRVPATAVTQPSTNASPAAGGLPTGEQLCALLTANDFATVNLTADDQPEVNSDAPGNAYCTYKGGVSGGEGGLELDAFVDASDSDAQGTFDTASGDTGASTELALPGADQAVWDSEDQPNVIVVRKGAFTFVIGVPPSDGSATQLSTLASVVLQRAASYT
jgi:hypothetical protein